MTREHVDERTTMPKVEVTLTKIVDNAFPIFGMFELIGVLGERILIHEKLPVVGVNESLLSNGLPISAELDCNVVSVSNAKALIDISIPHDVADIDGRTQFWVNACTIRD